MCDFMAIWAQSANAYRRYVPKAYVPMAAHWGFNNRNVALRIPRTLRRAERASSIASPGPTPIPYLVVAAILAGIRHGITNAIDPGQRWPKATAMAATAPQLPTVWFNALERFRHSNVVREAFGAPFQDVYFKLKQTERNNFERIVTSLDHEWYAHVA